MHIALRFLISDLEFPSFYVLVAKMIYYLDNSKKAAAVKIMTEMPGDLEDRTLEVRFHYILC